MDSQEKSSILQWLIPTGIMMVVVTVMLVSFSFKSKKAAELSVSKTLLTSTEDYGRRFLHELALAGKAGEPVCTLLEKEGTQDAVRMGELLSIAADCAGVEKVFYTDADGVGFDQTGAPVSVGDEEWFQTETFMSESFPYTYAGTDRATVVARPVGQEPVQGYLLLFYPMEHLSAIFAQSGYDSDSFLAIVDKEGNVLGVGGSDANECVRDGNIFDAVNVGTDQRAARELQNCIKNDARRSLYVRTKTQAQNVTFAPLVSGEWDIVLGVSASYADRRRENLCRNAKNMAISLLVVIGVFFCIVMVLNIVSKIRSEVKKKELEDKADTDLLTGLNNKLATERKIKDYMAKNPNTQSMMLLFDIDNFKKINDTLGHAFGDEVLSSLGKQIGSIFRASDIIGRVGGDEFMIFLKNIPNDEDIIKEARKVEEFFKGFQAGEYVKYKATASIGAAVFPQEGADFESLYKAADQGLYKAKERGKNQLAFYKDRTDAACTEIV